MVSYFLKNIVVTGAIIQEGKTFLIARRGPYEKSPGMWEFPGGKLEEGESLQECIKRELKEELSIDAVVGDLYCCYTYKSRGNVVRTTYTGLIFDLSTNSAQLRIFCVSH